MLTRRDFGRIAATAAGLGVTGFGEAGAKPSMMAKRGCCLAAKPERDWLGQLQQLSPAWMYSWGAKRPAGLPNDVEFVPMLWGDAGPKWQRRRIDDLKTRAAAGEVRHLLGFNEPDGFEQANMTVDRGLELWPDLMSVGVPLVSPGCVHPDQTWMNEFMAEVERRDLRVDAIAVHSYMGPSVSILVDRLESVYKRFGRPLWITEFAVGDWKAKSPAENRHSAKRIVAFMRELLPTLDALPFVHRYAWFSSSPSNPALGTSALFDESGRLTELGELYAGHNP